MACKNPKGMCQMGKETFKKICKTRCKWWVANPPKKES